MSGEPFPKEAQLARGERRYRRKVASPKQWQQIIAAKRGPCRVCDATSRIVDYHHLIPRSLGGDDVPDNIVPLCRYCHDLVTRVDLNTVQLLALSLSAAERAYVGWRLR